MLFGKLAELVGRNAHKRRHLVYKSARAARAGAVHTHFESAREEQNFRVLAAEFDHGVGVRAGFLHRALFGVDFLNERKPERVRNAHSRRAGHRNERFADFGEFFVQLAEHRRGGFGNLGEVAHVP